MKKLLLAPFLLASLFSFCVELKANPDSRYETNSSRLNISDPTRLNNNNSKQYSLRMNLTSIISYWEENKLKSYIDNSQPELSESFFEDLSSCQSAKRILKSFILSQTATRGGELKFYASCAPAQRSINSRYALPEYYKFQLDWIELKGENGEISREPEAYIPPIPAHFSTKSSCEENGRRHLIQIKGWNINSVTTYRHKFKSKYICIKTSNL